MPISQRRAPPNPPSGGLRRRFGIARRGAPQRSTVDMSG